MGGQALALCAGKAEFSARDDVLMRTLLRTSTRGRHLRGIEDASALNLGGPNVGHVAATRVSAPAGTGASERQLAALIISSNRQVGEFAGWTAQPRTVSEFTVLNVTP